MGKTQQTEDRSTYFYFKIMFKSQSQKADNNQIICVLPSENNLHQALTNQREGGSISINYFYTKLVHILTIRGQRYIQIKKIHINPMYAFSTVSTYISSYMTVQSILSFVSKLVKDKGRLTLFSTVCGTRLSRAKPGVDKVT